MKQNKKIQEKQQNTNKKPTEYPTHEDTPDIVLAQCLLHGRPWQLVEVGLLHDRRELLKQPELLIQSFVAIILARFDCVLVWIDWIEE